MQSHPNNFLGPVAQMSDCGETNLHAVGCKEDMLIDKEAVYCQFHLLVELDKFTRDLDDALSSPLGIGMSHVPRA